MKNLGRLLQTRLALRTAALTLLTVTVLGLVSLTVAAVISEQRERAQQYQRLEELLDTVERTVQIACFLHNSDLANEVAGGLLSNRIISRVSIRNGDDILAERGTTPAAPTVAPLVRPITSPFVAGEEVCRISLLPNADEIRRSAVDAVLFTTVVLALQLVGIGTVVVLVMARQVTRPIARVSFRLNTLHAQSGQKLEIPRGHAHDELGRLVASVNAMIDRLVSALRGERELRIQREIEERRFRTIFDNVETGIFELDMTGRLISANPAFRRMFQLPSDTELDKREVRLDTLTTGTDLELKDLIEQLATDTGSREMELSLGGEDHPRWVSVLLNRFEPGRLQGVANDITERRVATDAAERMAVTDPLTGLGNRRGLERRLAAAVRVYESNPAHRCSLVLLDLDRFKEANDAFGHAVGDIVLQHVGALLNELVRKTDYVARLGGDEFVVLLEGPVRHEHVALIIRRFLQRVNEPIIIDSKTQVHIGASLGIAVLGEDATTEQELLRLADAAMYEAKHAGRNTYRFHGA